MNKLMIKGHSTRDGAGVKLTRVFAHEHVQHTDPFLLLDHFGSNNPEDYIKGFPWHPHRGIETVTYMLEGTVEHGDSLGNSGTIGTGDIQWMTAGSGIIHQEMPKSSKGMMHGMQLWVNLPAKNKMMAPRYRGILAKDIPAAAVPGGEVRVIAGTFGNVNGPVHDLVVEVEYLDVQLKKGATLFHEARNGYGTFCYLIQGTGSFDGATLEKEHLVLFSEAGRILVEAMNDIRYIFVTGKQLKEPVAWGGPIVMNTQEELDLAFQEIEDGTFIKTDD